MPLYTNADDWTHQTVLLLQARPTTTRIVTKYTIPPLPSRSKVLKFRERRAQRNGSESGNKDPSVSDNTVKDPAEAAKERPPRAYLVLKAYDPETGVCLKYKTEKAAEAGRLIGQLSRMGKLMAAMPVDEEVGADKMDVDEEEASVTKVERNAAPQMPQSSQVQQQTQQSKSKKKKGKR